MAHAIDLGMPNTKYVAHAITNGTKIVVAVSAATPDRAITKLQRSRLTRHAGTYLVFERRTGCMVRAISNPLRRSFAL